MFEDHLHEQIGTRVFFHDRIIERWRCETEFDTALGVLVRYESKLCVCEWLCHKKHNLFIIFDDVTFNCEDKCCRLHVYVYDADFLLPGLHRELVHLSANILPMGYSIDMNNDIGLSSECQFRKIYVKQVNGYHNIVDIMHDFDESFDYFSTFRRTRCQQGYT